MNIVAKILQTHNMQVVKAHAYVGELPNVAK